MNKPNHRRIQPLIKMDHGNYHIAFFFEALVSAMAITLTIMLNDGLARYLHGKKIVPRWVRYLCHIIIIMVSTLVTIYLLFFMFGYGHSLRGVPSYPRPRPRPRRSR